MQDQLLESIRRFSVSDEPLSTATAQTFVDTFAPLSLVPPASAETVSKPNDGTASIASLKQARSTALLTLASRSSSTNAPTIPKTSTDRSSHINRIDENLPQLLTPVIRSRLADTTPHSLLSALHFFSALFSVLPSEAHDILTADGILDLVLEAPDACNAHKPSVKNDSTPSKTSYGMPSDQDLVSLAVAELLSSAANSTATRKYLAGQQAVLDWIDIACVSRAANTTHSKAAERRSDAIAIVAGLADIKVYRAIASEAVQGLTQSTSSQPVSQEDYVRKIQQGRSERKRKDDSLYRIVQAELLATTSQPLSQNANHSIQEADRIEHRRTVELSCLEVLAYLSVQPTFKERIATDHKLLETLCTGFQIAASKSSTTQQPLDIDSQRFDGALQLSLATILSNITAYPPSLTAEEKEVRRLRKFANAQGTKQDGGQADEEEQLETVTKVEQRCTAVLEAKGVEAISAIAVAGPPPSLSNKTASEAQSATSSWKVNPSKSVRRACGDALLALVTQQDRVVRGKAVQQGALKAVLALSAPILHNLAGSSSNTASSSSLFSRSAGASAAEVTSDDLAPLQALAKLLISLNPSLLFPSNDGLLSVASVTCSLLLCPSASRLQKFEALLALTNLASLSPDVCLRIASFSLDASESKEGKNKNGIAAFSSHSVLAQACEQLLMEDHTMVRRAWIELLVNLLQVGDVFRYFVSTGTVPSTASQPERKGTDESRDRLTLRLRMLLGLSEVDEWAYEHGAGPGTSDANTKAASGDGGGEPSLPTRMACLAILAMVTESSAVIEALLTLDRLFPVLISNIVLDRSNDGERNDWERADLQPANTDAKRSKGDTEAQVQLNAINLGLRASYVLMSVLQHLKASSSIRAGKAGGFSKDAAQTALQEALSHHVVQLKKAGEPAHVEEARKGLLQVMAECLKVVKEIKDV